MSKKQKQTAVIMT